MSSLFPGFPYLQCDEQFEKHVNFSNGEVSQLREEAFPMYQPGTHFDGRPSKVRESRVLALRSPGSEVCCVLLFFN